MSEDVIFERQWGRENDMGAAIPCVVTGIDLSGEPMVTVKPMQATRVFELDGVIADYEPLEIDAVPYAYPSGPGFALFVPPEVGMEGYLIATSREVGEAAGGKTETTRQRSRDSGVFVPSGTLMGAPFKGSPDWAEIRSSGCRVAVSKDAVHVEAAGAAFVAGPGGWDVVSNGVSLIAALKQIAARIKALEALPGHPGPTPLLVDQLTAQAVPVRAESGVR